MACHLVRRLCFAAIATGLALQGCDKPSGSFDRQTHRVATQAAAAAPTASPSAADSSSKNSERLPTPGAAALEQYQGEDPPPWLTELLHASDPNVRIQGLDAWARQPTASLDPVTYALVDPDEAVRARAQEVLERELGRR